MLNLRKSPKYYFDMSTGIERIRADEILAEIIRFFQYLLKAWKSWFMAHEIVWF